MQQDNGFTLLEFLIALVMATTLLSALLMGFTQFQRLVREINLIAERDENLRLAPVLLLQWIAAAGNNRWDRAWQGISLASGNLEVKSDLDGELGFPDGQLIHSYEDIAFRQTGENLMVRSGAGSFQPVLKNVRDFQVEREGFDLLTLQFAGSTRQVPEQSRPHPFESFEIKIHLWNYRSNLFSESER